MRGLLDYFWAALAVALAAVTVLPAGEAWRLEDLAYAGLHVQAAAWFLLRVHGVPAARNTAALLVPLGSVVYAFGFDMSGRNGASTVLVLTACGLCAVATQALGPCYAVFPAFRGLREHGPYGLVRHPLYASYILMDIGIVTATPSPRNVLLLVIGLVLYLWRIELEEGVLAGAASVDAYRARVPFKLIPRVY